MHLSLHDEPTPIAGLEERIEAIVSSFTPAGERDSNLSAHSALMHSRARGPHRDAQARWTLIATAIVVPVVLIAVGLALGGVSGVFNSLLGGSAAIPANVGHTAPMFQTEHQAAANNVPGAAASATAVGAAASSPTPATVSHPSLLSAANAVATIRASRPGIASRPRKPAGRGPARPR